MVSGLANTLQGKVDPLPGTLGELTSCAQAAAGLGGQFGQISPPDFWNDMEGYFACRSVYNLASQTAKADAGAVTTAGEDLTAGFIDDVAPKLIELAMEVLGR